MRRDQVLQERAHQKERLRAELAQLEDETPHSDREARALLLLIRVILLTKWEPGIGE